VLILHNYHNSLSKEVEKMSRAYEEKIIPVLEAVMNFPRNWGTKDELKDFLEKKLNLDVDSTNQILDFLVVNGFIKLGINKELKTTWQKTSRLEKTLKRWKFFQKLKNTIIED